MSINMEKMRKPHSIFILYVLISSVLIMIFRFIFPPTEAPLFIYSRDWRLIQGLLAVFNMFPALAFSGLVIPFGLSSLYEETYQSFSEMFFKRLVVSVITAICAAVIYAIIFFLAYPMVKNKEENLRFTGELYQNARRYAQINRDAGEWYEAMQFIHICERIWYNNNSPEFSALKADIEDNYQRYLSAQGIERSRARSLLEREWRGADIAPLSGSRQPLSATQALQMSEAAFRERRYFDAHWLATVGERMSPQGGPQAANASRLASEAWNMIASLAPNQREERLYQLYDLKLSGYQAMNTGDWIRAFYIFQELLTYTPDDPDVKNYLAASERGAKEYAFFIDEIELTLGEVLNGAVFSVPGGEGRAALRFSTLSASLDVAYGIGFEYMNFDLYPSPQAAVTARYVKLMPIVVKGKPQILVLTHALDRSDENNSFKGEWLLGSESPGGILLDISFEDFMLVSKVRHGLTNLQIDELFLASQKLDNAGYVYQIFQAEILNRLGTSLFFLPLAIFMIIIAWRYRAKARPRYLFVLLLPILPIIFHGMVFLYRSIFNTLGIWLVLSIGFASALVVYIVILGVSLFISLIALAAQHS